MSKIRIVLVTLSCFFLMGFDSGKLEVLVDNCVKGGTSTSTCRCALNFLEESLGPKFLEAMFLQATGDLRAYEKTLFEMHAEDPQIAHRAAQAEAKAKARC